MRTIKCDNEEIIKQFEILDEATKIMSSKQDELTKIEEEFKALEKETMPKVEDAKTRLSILIMDLEKTLDLEEFEGLSFPAKKEDGTYEINVLSYLENLDQQIERAKENYKKVDKENREKLEEKRKEMGI